MALCHGDHYRIISYISLPPGLNRYINAPPLGLFVEGQRVQVRKLFFVVVVVKTRRQQEKNETSWIHTSLRSRRLLFIMFAGPLLRLGPNHTHEQYIIQDAVLLFVPYCLYTVVTVN